MKSTIQILIIASLCCGVGCSKSKNEPAAGADTAKNTSLPVNTSSNSTAPVTSQPATVGQQTPAGTPVVTTGLNPAHGEPGHRCDIQVGAPLNSPPGVTVNPGVTPNSGATATPNARPSALPPAPVLPMGPPVTTAKGMNPPHGQPGHDCSIAVGAPLKK
ncbi:RodZ family helix-turn-helix domain-containing protein [Rufibacter latericius]|uniref:Uncharacterized protein n=1 Tax=Rufibacter latericius TaxID=2487040 RepID=A0A3M9N1H0_9BACT|nr:hypothetical protein [Rufibacter latericius]RNI31644.1 hypothetical protein EFB08_03820 [Rufibacter latericius]